MYAIQKIGRMCVKVMEKKLIQGRESYQHDVLTIHHDHFFFHNKSMSWAPLIFPPKFREA